MARPLSSTSSRSNHHHVPDIHLAALQGATTAFNPHPKDVKNRVQTMGTAVFPDTGLHLNSHDDAPQSHSLSDTDSIPLPEVGSVKDKIGRFTATSRGSSPLNHNQNHDASETNRRDLKLPIRPSTPQQIAARLAAERPFVRDEKSADPGGMMHTPSKITTPSSQPNKDISARHDHELPAPKAIRSPTAPSPALQTLLHREPPPLPERTPAIPRKPVTQTTPTSWQPPNFAQLAAARSSPSPSSSSTVPRKQPLLPSRSSTAQSSDAYLRGTNSSVDSLSFSKFSDETKPSLPPRPRPNGSPVPRGPPKSKTYPGIILQDLEQPPSVASLSTASHNNSSSSTLDRSTGMDEEALSDAIVASSIASAHAPPPRKVPPTPPKPRRRSRSRSILGMGHSHNNHTHHRRDSHGRMPSPIKGLRQTLRDPPKPETQHNHRHHRLSISRHPHKHHEGDRKRYQGTISEKERKRYEGVWAANKGLLIPTPPPPSSSSSSSYYKTVAQRYPPNAQDMVLNIVVRDIWSRSRLPPPMLSQIWDLVDRQKTGLLCRDEFVVGMWLIDQQLKGHKIPAKLQDSVWDSVRRLSGVREPPPFGSSHSLI